MCLVLNLERNAHVKILTGNNQTYSKVKNNDPKIPNFRVIDIKILIGHKRRDRAPTHFDPTNFSSTINRRSGTDDIDVHYSARQSAKTHKTC